MAGRDIGVFRLVVLAAMLLVLPHAAHAANNCPWLNEATASGYLGGNAVGTFVPAAQSAPASCTFVQSIPDGVRSLTITVDVVPDAHSRYAASARRCDGERQPVPAIGNEALRCTMKPRKAAEYSERIVGRVRDQLFSVTLSTTMKHDPSLTPGELAMRIYSAAEEVSGNLF